MLLASIKVSTDDVVRALNALDKDTSLAMMRALNKTIKSAESMAVKAVATDLAILQREVRKSMALHPASLRNLVAELVTTGRRIPLIQFKAKGPEPSRGKGKGVRYQLPSGQGTAPKAFIASVMYQNKDFFGPGLHRAVLMRKKGSVRKSRGSWSRNLPIYELKGPSIPKALGEERIFAAVRKGTGDTLVKNLNHEIDYILSKR